MMSTTSTELLGEKTRQRVIVMDYPADVDYCDSDDSSRELMVCRRRCRLLMLTIDRPAVVVDVKPLMTILDWKSTKFWRTYTYTYVLIYLILNNVNVTHVYRWKEMVRLVHR